MILSVNGTDYKVPEYLTIGKWIELSKWDRNSKHNYNRLISIMFDINIKEVEEFPHETKKMCIAVIITLMMQKSENKIGELKNFNKFTIGQWIDMEIYIGGGINNHIEPIVELLWENIEYDEDFPAEEIWDGIHKYYNFRETIFNRYKELFSNNKKTDDNEENESVVKSQDDVARSWYKILLRLASDDFLKLDDASKQPLIAALNYISYDKDKTTEEINRIKNMRR